MKKSAVILICLAAAAAVAQIPQKQTMLSMEQQEAVADLRALKIVADSLLLKLPADVRAQMLHELSAPPVAAAGVETVKPAHTVEIPGVKWARAVNGMQVFDTNSDGRLTAGDQPFWLAARLWLDYNGDNRIAVGELYDLSSQSVQAINFPGKTFQRYGGTVSAILPQQYLLFDLNADGHNSNAGTGQTPDAALVLDAQVLSNQGVKVYAQWGRSLEGWIALQSGMSVETPDGRRVPVQW